MTAIGLGIVNGLEALHLDKLLGGTCKTLTQRALCVLKKGEGAVHTAHFVPSPLQRLPCHVLCAVLCCALLGLWRVCDCVTVTAIIGKLQPLDDAKPFLDYWWRCLPADDLTDTDFMYGARCILISLSRETPVAGSVAHTCCCIVGWTLNTERPRLFVCYYPSRGPSPSPLLGPLSVPFPPSFCHH